MTAKRPLNDSFARSSHSTSTHTSFVWPPGEKFGVATALTGSLLLVRVLAGVRAACDLSRPLIGESH